MIKQKATFNKNFIMTSYFETDNDEVLISETYDDNGNLLRLNSPAGSIMCYYKNKRINKIEIRGIQKYGIGNGHISVVNFTYDDNKKTVEIITDGNTYRIEDSGKQHSAGLPNFYDKDFMFQT